MTRGVFCAREPAASVTVAEKVGNRRASVVGRVGEFGIARQVTRDPAKQARSHRREK